MGTTALCIYSPSIYQNTHIKSQWLRHHSRATPSTTPRSGPSSSSATVLVLVPRPGPVWTATDASPTTRTTASPRLILTTPSPPPPATSPTVVTRPAAAFTSSSSSPSQTTSRTSMLPRCSVVV